MLFKPALKYVALTMSEDTTRESLYMLYINGSNLVTSDGHRLHLAELENTSQIQVNESEKPVSINIHATGVEVLLHLLQSSSWASKSSDNSIIIEQYEPSVGFLRVFVNGCILETRSPDAKFPPYTQITPERHSADELFISTEGLTNAIKRLDKVNKKNVKTKLTVNSELKLSLYNDADDNSALQATTSVAYSTPRAVTDIYETALNRSFLLESLSASSDCGMISLFVTSDPLAPICVVPNEKPAWLSVIMPVRMCR